MKNSMENRKFYRIKNKDKEQKSRKLIKNKNVSIEPGIVLCLGLAD